jgi:hypothetical protein
MDLSDDNEDIFSPNPGGLGKLFKGSPVAPNAGSGSLLKYLAPKTHHAEGLVNPKVRGQKNRN